MCGIFGFVVNEKSGCGARAFEDALRLLFKLSEPRGREASGLALAGGDDLAIFKRAVSPSRLLGSEDFQAYLKDYVGKIPQAGGAGFSAPVAGLGHCRLVTNGSQSEQGNNQPLGLGEIAGVHNGIITNLEQQWADNPDLVRELDIDTEILFKRIDKAVEHNGGDLIQGVSAAFAESKGSASIAFFRRDMDAMTLATNTGSLYFAGDENRGWFVFASERYIVRQFLDEGVLAGMKECEVRHLAANTMAVVGLGDGCVSEVAFEQSGEVVRESLPERHAPKGDILDKSLYPMELKRCTRCLLPHTYPFIEFDEEGVCNYCHDFTKQKALGIEALQRRLDPFRSSGHDPDCIVALSGGRDSCFGLHFMKEEMGMNPIAYTYDWGLVTDLARRNQARLCGQLGVEHVIRADDIPTKRRYIRRNIEAWVKRPELGMVPIFMAGDKMFFHHARELSKETGIDTVVFCSGNELERCEFKVGFTGIKDTQVHEVLYRYPLWNKIRLALWYGKEYARNPAYFNESFFDSLFSFYSTFIAREDFIHLYHYVPWGEGLIDRTLKDTYDWEGTSESDNTWRVGDGYTSFINLIYYTVAGFSEYDTFRSNQIRAGLITREEGLAMAQHDNQARMGSLEEFARVIGFNLEEVLIRINAIPKLY